MRSLSCVVLAMLITMASIGADSSVHRLSIRGVALGDTRNKVASLVHSCGQSKPVVQYKGDRVVAVIGDQLERDGRPILHVGDIEGCVRHALGPAGPAVHLEANVVGLPYEGKDLLVVLGPMREGDAANIVVEFILGYGNLPQPPIPPR
ncbi:MAG: hypothetical protein ACRDHZ_19095 [Ktedonobacteraceae bacterium]